MDASCHSISKNLKKVLNKNQSDSSNILLFDHQISKNNHSLATGISNSKGIYPMYISSKGNILTSRIYFEKKKTSSLEILMEGHIKTSSQIYCKCLLQVISVLNTKNMLYLNKKNMYIWFIKQTTMFFLRNRRRGNKSPILLLNSSVRYLEASSDLFH